MIDSDLLRVNILVESIFIFFKFVEYILSVIFYRYRGFNVPHQAASWYAMYRIARNYDLLPTYSTWDYYLIRALNTTLNIGSANVGFMDGTIFREILVAALIEGQNNSEIMTIAQQVNTNMVSIFII